MLDLSAQLADAGSKDIRIEAALAKLWSSEMAWKVADELVQIRGGRGYETADSMAARGERSVPAEQILRDLRINRIFEGSTEIMHLLIAREAVDTHLQAAGALADKDAVRQGQGEGRRQGQRLLRQVVPEAGRRQGHPARVGTASSTTLATHLRFVERSSRKLARQTFYGMSRWQAKLEYRQSFLGRIVDIGAELFAMAAVCSRARMLRDDDPTQGAAAFELADAFCQQSRLRVEELFGRLWANTDDTDKRDRRRGARRRLRLARGRRHRPVRGHRPVDLGLGPRPEREEERLAALRHLTTRRRTSGGPTGPDPPGTLSADTLRQSRRCGV